MGRQLHIGAAYHGVGGPGQYSLWQNPELEPDAGLRVEKYVEWARIAEDAKLDFFFIADSTYITNDSPPHYLARLEPLTLLSAVAMVTSRIGLVGTVSSSYNSPFNVARRFASLDLISHGRAGWNVVTTQDEGTAGNYGRKQHYDYAERYGRAHEIVGVVQELWDSYEDDAFPYDRETGQFVDHSKRHEVDHHGEHFDVEGALNITRSRQGQPVIFQAGNSPEGRDLGAETAEAIFTFAPNLEAAKAFYTDIKTRAVAAGRRADDILILPGINPIIADTVGEARAREQAIADEKPFDRRLAAFSRSFGWHDFTQYDYDAPFPDLGELGDRSGRTQSSAIKRHAAENGLTLRETVLHFTAAPPSPFVGTAETIADTLELWLAEGGLDGVILLQNLPSDFHRFADEVVPLLQERGIFRTEYEADTLRGNLGLDVPANRYTAAAATATVTRP
ncbi:LLM class flavin-dependent oxidoreductase [Frondihabitans australicus]|uniref:FMN-dependent oxidoreductase (Nitrilotriacetate monooxygenase family) n=1 Tax=Frondihabitans australicus TaxID=386892 RepID=A0A495IBB7_9MICO|nr:LLM class flavin-dependent oxidoreductase [Frondihabitans australicus]RKR73297.1 FMN-dependent oxidoreductase (nitrilotriacetate monooxygenase family) [Frondihabitans australicus]